MGYVSTREETDQLDQYGRQLPTGSMMYMGAPDGPKRFIKSLGMEVPTYVNPRDDLKTKANCASAHISVDYHVPPHLRGTYIPSDLPDYDPDMHYALTGKGKARCGGIRPDGQICQKSAMNRSGFCTNHGGALHPADKFYTADRGVAPTDIERLTRLEKVLLGIIPVSELSNEEISRQKIRDTDGSWVEPNAKIAPKLAEEMNREFYARANRFIRENTLDMLEVMVDIAKSQLAEDADRQKAAQWMIERSLGKTPDVLITSKTEKPFEQLMADVVSGSRDDYRKQQSAIENGNIIEGEFHVIEEQDDEAEDQEPAEQSEAQIQRQLPPNSEDQGVQQSSDTAQGDAQANASRNGNEHVVIEEGSQSLQAGGEAPTLSGGDDRYQAIVDRQQSAVDLAKQRADLKDARMRIKRRKYAAKAQGQTTLDNLAYGIEFTRKASDKAVKEDQWRMKLIAPDDTKLPRTG